MKKKTKIQQIAEITYEKVLKDHARYFKESFAKPYFERLQKIRFDRQGNVVGSDSELLTFSYKAIYHKWRKIFEEAKKYVESNS